MAEAPALLIPTGNEHTHTQTCRVRYKELGLNWDQVFIILLVNAKIGPAELLSPSPVIPCMHLYVVCIVYFVLTSVPQ